MPTENSQFNESHAASIGYVNAAIEEAWEKFKIWLTTNVDQLDYVARVISQLRSAYRGGTFTTATEYAQAIDVASQAMVASFTSAGIDLTGLTMADFAMCIDQIATNSGVYINDTDGVKWTWERWASEKQRLGHDPAVKEGILLHNPDHDVLVASRNYGTMQFGTYSHTIPNLQAMSGGNAGTPKEGKYNSRKILAATNPDALRDRGWAIDYYEGMTRFDLTDIDVVFFPNQETLTAWATELGLYEMLGIGTAMIYAIPHATEEGKWVLKYFSGSTSIAFANREAVAPYTDNYGQLGCTPMQTALTHKENPDDVNFWRLPSAFEALMIYLNKTEINNCRTVLEQTALPSGGIWLCLQNSGNLAYYLSLADGSSNYTNKYYTSNVVLVAS